MNDMCIMVWLWGRSVDVSLCSGYSLGGDSKLHSCFGLLHSECAEEINLLLGRGLPLVVRLECAFEMRLDVYVERLRL